MAKATNRSLPRAAGDPADANQLCADWTHCVQDRQSNFWTRQRLNWESRYCVWPNQTSDGRKWPKNAKSKVWPFPGAADSRVHLIDKYAREDVAMLMQVWFNQRALVRPNAPAKDAAWANRMTSLLRWQIYDDMAEAEDEAEYLANLLVERGVAALGIWWDKTEIKVRETLEMAPLIAAGQQAQMRIARGEQGDALAFQAQLPALILDPSMETQAVELLNGMAGAAPELTKPRLKKALRDLRETGVCYYPRKIIQKNRPCVRTLAWNEDIWTPPETVDLQRSRQVFVRELLTDADLADRGRLLGWDEDWTEKVIEQTRGRMTELQPIQGRRGAAAWNSLGTPDADQLYELLTAYERLLDEDGISGIYVTPLSPHLPKDKALPDSTLLDYAHGEYPFAVWQSERRSRLADDARGYGEVASTWQQQIKRQWDARIDRTDMATLPPSHHPPGEEPDAWGPGVSIGTLQPQNYGYFESPKFDPMSKEVEETVRRFADEYFGRPVDEQNVVQAQTLQQELVRRWLHGWKRAATQILQLDQQYLPDEFYFRVVGSEQGRGIRATKEEIQGPFNVTLRFNVKDFDAELVKEKLALMQQALALDSNAIVDRNEAIRAAFELIDPGFGERLLRPAEAAMLGEVDEEQTALTKILLGIPVDLKGNEAFAVRKRALVKTVQSSQAAQQMLRANPQAQQALEQRVKDLDQAFQNAPGGPNAVIGRGGPKFAREMMEQDATNPS